MKDAGQNAMNNIGNTTEDGMNYVENMLHNENGNNNYRYNGTNNGSYSTGRTSAPGTNTNNGNTWLWIILGVVALIIIGLSWYYMTDNKNNNNQ